MKYLLGLIPVVIALFGSMAAFVAVYLWRERERRFLRQSPLVRDLLRPPGHSLRRKIEDIGLEIDACLVGTIMIPLLVFSMHVTQSYLGEQPESATRIALSIGAGLVFAAIAGRKLIKLLNEQKRYILGLEGELATAEELNQLMMEGCRVFHDIPTDYGNIDHVVVSRSGVFVVETKMRGKPQAGDGRANAFVDRKQGVIHFPDGKFPIPSKQLQTEARWLADFLASSVGQPVDVEPMLALPGWFVEGGEGRGSVCVINPRKATRYFVHDRQILSHEIMQQVAHQLEQICRDVERSFHKKPKGWDDQN